MDLSRDDIGPRTDHRPGITLWRPDASKVGGFAIAWDDLVICGLAAIGWPEGCQPTATEGWAHGVRVVWHPELFRYTYFAGAPVPELKALRELEGQGLAVKRFATQRGSHESWIRDSGGELVGRLPALAWKRISAGVREKATLRLVAVGSSPALLVWGRQNLRAVAALTPVGKSCGTARSETV